METIELTIRIPKPNRRWLQFRLRTLLLVILLIAVAIGWWVSPRSGEWSWSELHSAVLLSRSKYDDYERATFSFEHGTRDDPEGVVNSWDLEFGNGGDFFDVTMVTDDRSRIIDLGEHTWESFRLASLPPLPAHPDPTDEPHLPAVAGHIYMVRTKDTHSDLYALFRVESLEPDDRCRITWRTIRPRDEADNAIPVRASQPAPDELSEQTSKLMQGWTRDVRARLEEGAGPLKRLAAQYPLVVLHAAFPNRYSYLQSAYSFTHESALPSVHGNNVHVQFVYRPANTLQFNLLPDHRNLIVDLGAVDFEQNPDPGGISLDHAGLSFETTAAIEAHVYLMRVHDEQNDFYVLFQVVEVDPDGQYVAFLWRRLPGGTMAKSMEKQPVHSGPLGRWNRMSRAALLPQLPTELATLWPQWEQEVQSRVEEDDKLSALAARHPLVVLHSKDLYSGGETYIWSAYSFIHQSVEPRVHANDAQLVFHQQNGPPKAFECNIEPGQQNVVVDLGPVDFEQDPGLDGIGIDHPGGPARSAQAVEGHVYLELVRDDRGNHFYVLFQVVAVDPESRYAAFIWRKLPGGTVVK